MMCEYTVWYHETNVVLNDPLSLDSCTHTTSYYQQWYCLRLPTP